MTQLKLAFWTLEPQAGSEKLKSEKELNVHVINTGHMQEMLH